MFEIKEHSIVHTVLKMVTCQDVGIHRFFRNWIWQHCWMSFLIQGHGSETGCMPLLRKADTIQPDLVFEDLRIHFLIFCWVQQFIQRFVDFFNFLEPLLALGLLTRRRLVWVRCHLVVGHHTGVQRVQVEIDVSVSCILVWSCLHVCYPKSIGRGLAAFHSADWCRWQGSELEIFKDFPFEVGCWRSDRAKRRVSLLFFGCLLSYSQPAWNSWQLLASALGAKHIIWPILTLPLFSDISRLNQCSSHWMVLPFLLASLSLAWNSGTAPPCCGWCTRAARKRLWRIWRIWREGIAVLYVSMICQDKKQFRASNARQKCLRWLQQFLSFGFVCLISSHFVVRFEVRAAVQCWLTLEAFVSGFMPFALGLGRRHVDLAMLPYIAMVHIASLFACLGVV